MPSSGLHPFLSSVLDGGLTRRRPLSSASALLLSSAFSSPSQPLHCNQLHGHQSCVNAIEFSPYSKAPLLASAGDDRKILLWDLGKAIDDDATTRSSKEPFKRFDVLEGGHENNILALAFHFGGKFVSSGGYDERVCVWDMTRPEVPVKTISHTGDVYGLSAHPTNESVFLSAGSDGRVLLYDFRAQNMFFELMKEEGRKSEFHAAEFNPVSPRMMAVANVGTGLQLLDVRQPGKAVLKYGSAGGKVCDPSMSVAWTANGQRILTLRRRLGPAVYSADRPEPIAEFNARGYLNSCTMKAGSFAGFNDEYVTSGSDDKGVYVWTIPEEVDAETVQVEEADYVLRGHRSIVNQTRFCRDLGAITTAGVEKVVKMWSCLKLPNSTTADRKLVSVSDTPVADPSRGRMSPRQYLNLVLAMELSSQSDYADPTGQNLSNQNMLSFFDDLVEQEVDQNRSSSSSEPPSSSGSDSDADHDDPVVRAWRRRRRRARERSTVLVDSNLGQLIAAKKKKWKKRRDKKVLKVLLKMAKGKVTNDNMKDALSTARMFSYGLEDDETEESVHELALAGELRRQSERRENSVLFLASLREQSRNLQPLPLELDDAAEEEGEERSSASS